MSVNTILVFLLLVAAGIVGGVLLYHGFRWLRAWGDRGRYQIDGLLLRVLGPPVRLMVALVSIHHMLPERQTRIEMPVRVAYDADLDRATPY